MRQGVSRRKVSDGVQSRAAMEESSERQALCGQVSAQPTFQPFLVLARALGFGEARLRPLANERQTPED